MSHLGGIEKYIQPGDRVLVKPNLIEGADKGKYVTTHPEIFIHSGNQVVS
ncbi:MAG: hypothetical protein H6Q69_475 [Firmicutes bacterium]|nr:hypothetical protein [Bacillota bacterium]